MSVPFSWALAKKEGLKHKIDRAMLMSNNHINPDFDIKHPDWVRDAQNKNYTNLKKIIKEQVEKQQAQVLKRREKLHGKN